MTRLGCLQGGAGGRARVGAALASAAGGGRCTLGSARASQVTLEGLPLGSRGGCAARSGAGHASLTRSASAALTSRAAHPLHIEPRRRGYR